MRRVLKKLSSMRLKPKNPTLRQFQKLSESSREKMIKKFEENKTRQLKEFNAQAAMESESTLYSANLRRAMLKERKMVSKSASYLMKKGYTKIQANAIATAFSGELNQLKLELSKNLGANRSKLIMSELEHNLLSTFRNPVYMELLIKETHSHEKRFSYTIFHQVKKSVLGKYGLG